MSTVALAGDWHGNRRWARARIAEVAANGVALILHLGDVGIWPGASGRVYIDQLEEARTTHGVGIWATPGNHEDWGSLTRMWADPGRAGRPLYVTEHIAILPRGYRFPLEDRSFVSLSGASSVDLEYRERNKDWWAQEAIEAEDVATVVAGGYADVMLVHDPPLGPHEVPSMATICSTKGMSVRARPRQQSSRRPVAASRAGSGPHDFDLAPRRSGAIAVANLAPIWHQPPPPPQQHHASARLGGPNLPSPVSSKRAPSIAG